jgi:hypothetical protein
MALDNIAECGDFQAEYEGSIPFTRSARGSSPAPKRFSSQNPLCCGKRILPRLDQAHGQAKDTFNKARKLREDEIGNCRHVRSTTPQQSISNVQMTASHLIHKTHMRGR